MPLSKFYRVKGIGAAGDLSVLYGVVIAVLYFLITFAIMAVSIFLIYRAARFFGLQVDRWALLLCAVMAVGVNFASIYLSNILTLDHVMVVIGLVLLAAALVTLLNEYLLRRHAPVLAGAEGALTEEALFTADAEEEAPDALLTASLTAVGVSAAMADEADDGSVLDMAASDGALGGEAAMAALSPPDTEARTDRARHRVLAEVIPLALVEEKRADTAPIKTAHLPAERAEEEKNASAPSAKEAGDAAHRAVDEASDGVPIEVQPPEADARSAVEVQLSEGDALSSELGRDLAEEAAASSAESLSTADRSLLPDKPRQARVSGKRRALHGFPRGKRRFADRGQSARMGAPARTAFAAPPPKKTALPAKSASASAHKAPPLGIELARLVTLDDHIEYAFRKRGEGNVSSAVLAYQQALGKFRRDSYAPFVVMELGNLYKENGDYAEAVSAYHSALRLSVVKDQPMMAAEFQKNIAYLDTVLLVLTRHRIPNTPFSQIPSDCRREIESAFAARQPKNINAQEAHLHDQKKRGNS